MSFDFEDIRPYRNDEVEKVLAELLVDPEFLNAIASVKLPFMFRVLPLLARRLVQQKLAPLVAQVHGVADFQEQVESYLDTNLKRTSSFLSTSGVDHLDSSRTYVFISNHRDIVMDPALCNLVLHRAGRDTFRIAIGDNLLSKPFAERLMRINKSFLVRRSVAGRKQKFLEFQKLSAYINHSISIDHQSVWIAHREGRAKDGIDRTDPALLKMLALNGPVGTDFASRIGQLHLVPVAVSYEWDPCDVMKARELACKHRDGCYQKGQFEDIESIARGIQGTKGHIQVAFGEEISQRVDTADELAAEIDRQIIQNYQLHPSNLAAWRLIGNEIPESLPISEEQLSQATRELTRRAEELQPEDRHFLFDAYANPVRSWIELAQKEPLTPVS